MEWTLRRRPTAADWMFGDLTTGGSVRCYSLEDELRQVKVAGETAIPAGRYQLIMEYSPKFKRERLTLLKVPDFKAIRIHSVRSDDDTEGCIGIGNHIDEKTGEISGGVNAGVRAALEAEYRAARDRDEEVWLTILNAPGDRYVDTHELAGGDEAVE